MGAALFEWNKILRSCYLKVPPDAYRINAKIWTPEGITSFHLTNKNLDSSYSPATGLNSFPTNTNLYHYSNSTLSFPQGHSMNPNFNGLGWSMPPPCPTLAQPPTVQHTPTVPIPKQEQLTPTQHLETMCQNLSVQDTTPTTTASSYSQYPPSTGTTILESCFINSQPRGSAFEPIQQTGPTDLTNKPPPSAC